MTDDRDTICPYCHKNSAMIYVEGSARLVDPRDSRAEAAYQCVWCNRFVIGGRQYLGFQSADDPRPDWGMARRYEHATPDEIADALRGEVEYWQPVEPGGKAYPDVPPELAGPADEAWRCNSIGARRAAVLMARAVIEAVAKQHDIVTGTLYNKIEELHAKNLIREVLKDGAHEVRLIGNDMAHGDFATSVITADDSLDVLELMDDVLDEALALTTRVRRRRERRTGTAEQLSGNESATEMRDWK